MYRSVEPFDPARHKRVGFNSGIASIDNYLKLTARKHQDANIATVFVLADETEAVIGYNALKSMHIDASELGGSRHAKLFARFSEVPATLLSMLGVDQFFQGQGIGKMLLADALRRSLAASKLVASHCIVLDILKDGNEAQFARRAALYQRLGFKSCAISGQSRMYVTMSDIAASLPSESADK
jgi:ribosomal protein S18 acetylase RimI-like enzyme